MQGSKACLPQGPWISDICLEELDLILGPKPGIMLFFLPNSKQDIVNVRGKGMKSKLQNECVHANGKRRDWEKEDTPGCQEESIYK